MQDYVLDTDFEWAQYPEHVRQALWAAQSKLEHLTEWYFANELREQLALPTPYSETPVERYRVVSTVESPHPWMARRALQDFGVNEGITIIDATRRRAPVVNTTAIEVDIDNTEVSAEEVQRQLAAQRWAAAAPNGRARSRLTARMRRRRQDDSSRNG
jgi:hypothetical protein